MVKGVHGERGDMGGEGGGEHGRGYAWMVGAYMVGGVCGRACMAGHAWQEGHACMTDGHRRWQYASYWNAFL